MSFPKRTVSDFAVSGRRCALAVVAMAVVWLPAVAQAQPPRSSLRLAAEGRADTLTVPAGRAVRMYLDLPDRESWTQANIGHFVVRTYGKQETVSPVPSAGTSYVKHTFEEPGLAMIILAAGPATEKGRSDSWQRTTHCTKLIVRVGPGEPPKQAEGFSPRGRPRGSKPLPLTFRTGEARLESLRDSRNVKGGARLLDPGLTAKVGDKTEILPLVAPTSLRIGHHLPVRAYFEGEKQSNSPVTAHRPDGSTEVKRTDSVGTTFFPITQSGRWIIRYEKVSEGTTYVGDLVFEVPADVDEQGGKR